MPEVRVILLCAPLLFSGKFQVVAASPFPLEHYPRFLDSCPSLFPDFWIHAQVSFHDILDFFSWNWLKRVYVSQHDTHFVHTDAAILVFVRSYHYLVDKFVRNSLWETGKQKWHCNLDHDDNDIQKIDTKSYFVIRNVSITWWSLSIAVIGVSAGKGTNNAARQDDRQAVRRARDDKDIMVSSGWVSRWKECNKRTMASTFSQCCLYSTREWVVCWRLRNLLPARTDV